MIASRAAHRTAIVEDADPSTPTTTPEYVLSADIPLSFPVGMPCVRGRDVADARRSAISGQEALVPTGVAIRPFGAATHRDTLGR